MNAASLAALSSMLSTSSPIFVAASAIADALYGRALEMLLQPGNQKISLAEALMQSRDIERGKAVMTEPAQI